MIVLQQAIQKDGNFENIEKLIMSNRILFEKIIKNMRSIIPNSNYMNQELLQGASQTLKLPRGFYPIICNGDGNCLYNTISLLYYGKSGQNEHFIIKMCSIFILFEYRKFFTFNLMIFLQFF